MKCRICRYAIVFDLLKPKRKYNCTIHENPIANCKQFERVEKKK